MDLLEIQPLQSSAEFTAEEDEASFHTWFDHLVRNRVQLILPPASVNGLGSHRFASSSELFTVVYSCCWVMAVQVECLDIVDACLTFVLWILYHFVSFSKQSGICVCLSGMQCKGSEE